MLWPPMRMPIACALRACNELPLSNFVSPLAFFGHSASALRVPGATEGAGTAAAQRHARGRRRGRCTADNPGLWLARGLVGHEYPQSAGALQTNRAAGTHPHPLSSGPLARSLARLLSPPLHPRICTLGPGSTPRDEVRMPELDMGRIRYQAPHRGRSRREARSPRRLPAPPTASRSLHPRTS